MRLTIKKPVAAQIPQKDRRLHVHLSPMKDWAYRERESIDLAQLTDKESAALRACLVEHAQVRGTKVLVRDIDQWAKARGGSGATKARSVEQFATFLTQYIATAPRRWIFQQMPDGLWMPAYVDSIRYYEPHQRDSSPYVSMALRWYEFGALREMSTRFWSGSIFGMTTAEALANQGFTLATSELVAEYESDVAQFNDLSGQIGLQCWATGHASDDCDGNPDSRRDSWYWRSTHRHNMQPGDTPSRVCIDVFQEEAESDSRRRDPSIDRWFWQGVEGRRRDATASTRRRARRAEDADDLDAEDLVEDFDAAEPQIPLRTYVAVFDFARHLRLRILVRFLTPYVYDTKLVDKLILPPALKALVGMLVEHQADAFTDLVRGKGGGAIVLLAGPPGVGKCLGRGTPVLRADGRVVPVEHIRSGDRLMGPDGAPRTVLSTNRGRGRLCRIVPTKGDPWVCNDVHVLTLVQSGRGAVVDIPVDQWRERSATFRARHKLFHVGVDRFADAPSERPIDPYFLGLWFGDGAKHVRDLAAGPALRSLAISKPDAEVRATCRAVAKAWGLRIRTQMQGTCPTYHFVCADADANRLLDTLRTLVGSDVQIPSAYLFAPRAERLRFLAGFLDADGELQHNCFTISQRREDWARGLWWIARSLGFGATMRLRRAGYAREDGSKFTGQYWVVTISGHVDQIPTRLPRKQASPRKQRKDVTRTGFTVEDAGTGAYYGFTLDGDGRFLLGDFTVTHNTLTAEVYAESEERCLYSVQCSQLGTDPDELEDELLKVFARAARWNAVLLLDEADVYVHERGRDLDQNAIVGVFLRVLEYQGSVMFLTTNRPQDVDDAICSRCIARLPYPRPTLDEQKQIWRVLADTSDIPLTDAVLAQITQIHTDLTGRDIKNLLKLANLLQQGEPITESAVTFARQFQPTGMVVDELQDPPKGMLKKLFANIATMKARLKQERATVDGGLRSKRRKRRKKTRA